MPDQITFDKYYHDDEKNIYNYMVDLPALVSLSGGQGVRDIQLL